MLWYRDYLLLVLTFETVPGSSSADTSVNAEAFGGSQVAGESLWAVESG